MSLIIHRSAVVQSFAAAWRADRQGWERRQLLGQLRNVLARERDLDRELAARPAWSEAWWRTVRRLDIIRGERLGLERAARRLGGDAP